MRLFKCGPKMKPFSFTSRPSQPSSPPPPPAPAVNAIRDHQGHCHRTRSYHRNTGRLGLDEDQVQGPGDGGWKKDVLRICPFEPRWGGRIKIGVEPFFGKDIWIKFIKNHDFECIVKQWRLECWWQEMQYWHKLRWIQVVEIYRC